VKAFVLEEGQLAVREMPMPNRNPGEALIRVTMAGICNTDLEIAKGYMGFSGVLGHELCGVIEASDDGRHVGKRVAGEINLACRNCELCKRGLMRHCSRRSVLGIAGKDGCFAEYVTLPLRNLHLLPDALSDVRACFVEPTAAAFEILEQVTVMSTDQVAVLGDGKLGLLIAQVLEVTGCELTLVGKHPHKLGLAEKRGTRCAQLDQLPRKAFDVVVEATGSKDGLRAAIELTRPRGIVVLKSTHHGEVQLDLAPIVIDELSVIGSRCGPFERAIAALSASQIDPDAMVDAVVPLAQAEAAFEHAARPGVLKVLLDMRK
jgi:threonine dehydrogenase-like Zn-dependent dehydrogenase